MKVNPFGPFQIFKSRTIYLLIASVVTFTIGAASTYLANMLDVFVFPPATGLLMLTVIAFSFGFLFFGYLAPVVMFFIGIHIGLVLRLDIKTSAFVIGAAVCSLLACYASIRLGDALLDDLRGKGNFKTAWQITSIVLAVALVLAFSLDFTFAG